MGVDVRLGTRRPGGRDQRAGEKTRRLGGSPRPLVTAWASGVHLAVRPSLAPSVTPTPDPDADLADLARGVRAGDLAAFEALFRLLHPMLSRIAHSLTDRPAEADDAVQETFARLWERRERVDPERSVRAYLARSVRNRMLNARRDAQTRATLLADNAGALQPRHAARPDEATHGAGLAERLRAFLDELPDRQRTAIALTRFDGLSHLEAAAAMDCSPRTVNNHIVRGLRTLRDRLRAYDPDAV